jgi:hypothetical protein
MALTMKKTQRAAALKQSLAIMPANKFKVFRF